MGPNHCTICGAITLVSSATGLRIHALTPKEPHNVVLLEPPASGQAGRVVTLCDDRERREAHARGEHRSRDIWCSSCLSEGGAKATARRTAARKGAAKRRRS